jgi:hypothetical protein
LFLLQLLLSLLLLLLPFLVATAVMRHVTAETAASAVDAVLTIKTPLAADGRAHGVMLMSSNGMDVVLLPDRLTYRWGVWGGVRACGQCTAVPRHCCPFGTLGALHVDFDPLPMVSTHVQAVNSEFKGSIDMNV